MITNINQYKNINEAVDIKSDIIDIKLLTQYATAIELLCNGEYGYTYFDPENNYIAVCLGDSNPFGDEELHDWIKWSVCDYKKAELIKVEIDCEWVPDTPYIFKNGKWNKQ